MLEKSNKFQLITGIISKSNSITWEEAVLEWETIDIYSLNDWEESLSSLCWHYPIRNICLLKNSKNTNLVIVWNICVKKFISDAPDKIFTWINTIRKDNWKWPSRELVEWMYLNKAINKYEYDFCIGKFWAKKFYGKQLEFRKTTNDKMVLFFSKKIRYDLH